MKLVIRLAPGVALMGASALFGISRPNLDGGVVLAILGWAAGLLYCGRVLDVAEVEL